MKQYEIRVYETEEGAAPFQNWIESLKDKKAKTVLTARIARAEGGNFGDWKAISGVSGLCEMRIHFGQGFRVFYVITGKTIILLLAGSTKQEQDRTIAKAKEYLADYNRRVK